MHQKRNILENMQSGECKQNEVHVEAIMVGFGSGGAHIAVKFIYNPILI